MPSKKETPRGRGQDRQKVAGKQDHEVSYEKDKTGSSSQEVKDTIKKVGNSRKKVDEALSTRTKSK